MLSLASREDGKRNCQCKCSVFGSMASSSTHLMPTMLLLDSTGIAMTVSCCHGRNIPCLKQDVKSMWNGACKLVYCKWDFGSIPNNIFLGVISKIQSFPPVTPSFWGLWMGLFWFSWAKNLAFSFAKLLLEGFPKQPTTKSNYRSEYKKHYSVTYWIAELWMIW